MYIYTQTRSTIQDDKTLIVASSNWWYIIDRNAYRTPKRVAKRWMLTNEQQTVALYFTSKERAIQALDAIASAGS